MKASGGVEELPDHNTKAHITSLIHKHMNAWLHSTQLIRIQLVRLSTVFMRGPTKDLALSKRFALFTDRDMLAIITEQ